jgi:hypothetical protein
MFSLPDFPLTLPQRERLFLPNALSMELQAARCFEVARGLQFLPQLRLDGPECPRGKPRRMLAHIDRPLRN